MNSRCRDLLIELGTIVPVSRRDLTERIEALLREDVATDGVCCGRKNDGTVTDLFRLCGCPSCRDARRVPPAVDVSHGGESP